MGSAGVVFKSDISSASDSTRDVECTGASDIETGINRMTQSKLTSCKYDGPCFYTVHTLKRANGTSENDELTYPLVLVSDIG